jgi:hypothetical protein
MLAIATTHAHSLTPQRSRNRTGSPADSNQFACHRAAAAQVLPTGQPVTRTP